ncbi:hypothetical protein AAG570_008299 [Ranatra chinensis]|uniref:FHA domain-containing protein n=1 Tax=Ranatra chinensis TaxID=642074 RepID=A0ABD0XSR3_9HEMI
MASKRRNMFHKNKTRETTENDMCKLPPFCDTDGETLIGTDAASQKQHIVLTGTEMVPEHCSIVLENGTATLIPKPNALCWVNGHLIEKPTVLFQGSMKLRKISGSERLLVRKSMNTNEVDNISSLVCAQNHLENLNMLALVDKEITIKDVAVSVNEIKVRALESELNQIVPFDSDPMNHKSIDPSEENMHVCSIEEDEISKSAAS